LVVLGLLSGGIQWPWVSWQSLVAIGGGICSLVLFGLQERRAPEPILPTWVMGTRLLTGANLGSMCVGLTVIGLTTYIPMFAQGVLGTGAVVAGFVLAVMSIGWPVASSQSAKLYLRIGFRDTALLGVGAMFAATAIFLTVGVGDSPLHAAAGSVVMGVGLGLLSTPLLVGVQSVVGWGRRGVVTGAQMFTRTLGSALGAAIFGGIANSTLSSWLQDAPTGIADQLPGSINGASKLLSNGGGADPQVVAYVRDGLFEAVHWVFWGIGVVAVLALVVLLLTPRRFKPLDEEME
ncbi:MAG: MFS transporter, partial [Nocardioidaceae bacterium]